MEWVAKHLGFTIAKPASDPPPIELCDELSVHTLPLPLVRAGSAGGTGAARWTPVLPRPLPSRLGLAVTVSEGEFFNLS